MNSVGLNHSEAHGWAECLWEGTKTQVANLANRINNLYQILIERIQAIFNFIYPKNAITGYRELWYIPTCVEKYMGKVMYPFYCAWRGGKLNDTDKQTRLNDIVRNIAQHAQRKDEGQKFEYEATVIDTDKINAWALPGGKLAFNKGLINKIDQMDLSQWNNLTKEDVIAAAVGHEVAHAAIGHARKRLEKTLLIQLAILIGKFISNIFISRSEQETIQKNEKNNINSSNNETADERKKYEGYRKLVSIVFDFFVDKALKLYMLMDSRSAEYEADKYGIKLMYNAGYDVRGSLALQRLFQEIGHSHQSDSCLAKAMEWISTHPTSEKRFAENEKTVQSIINHHGGTKAIR